MTARVKLYSYWRSSSAYRVRIALALKGIDHEIVPVHLLRDGGEQKKADFAAVNPLHQVPALELEIDGERHVITQSMAIIELLDELYPEPPLLPPTAASRAHARQLAEIVCSGIQPLQNLDVLVRLKAHGVDRRSWGQDVIARGLTALETTARPGAGQFLVGDSVSVADIMLIPQLFNARRFDIDVSEFPTLARVEATCLAQPAFIAAHPDNQPDAETA